MTQTRREVLKTAAAVTLTAMLPASMARAEGTVHEVQMLNVHPDDKKKRQVFVPDIVRAQPGDTIKFIAADKGHNAESNEDMLPEGAEGWEGPMNKDVEVTLTTEGAYGYYCKPHQALGMVGLILVGDVSGNYEALKEVKQRGKAKKVFPDIFERADAMLAAEAS
ncbi:MAG: pseudoazurin [Mangrovicoccus sp.]|nr:pseudoazurin [Mangrovicoccus sp.]